MKILYFGQSQTYYFEEKNSWFILFFFASWFYGLFGFLHPFSLILRMMAVWNCYAAYCTLPINQSANSRILSSVQSADICRQTFGAYFFSLLSISVWWTFLWMNTGTRTWYNIWIDKNKPRKYLIFRLKLLKSLLHFRCPKEQFFLHPFFDIVSSFSL